jgi:hypothetical protein
MKKVTKETTKFLNSPSKNDEDIKVYTTIPSFKYKYERLFVEHDYLICKEKKVKLKYRFKR